MDFDGNPIEEAAEFDFVNDRPELFFRLLGPTAQLLVDLVEAETTFAPTVTRRSLLDNRRMHKVKRAQPVTPAVVGNLLALQNLVRDIPNSAENGVGFNLVPLSASDEGFAFANGTQVPNGSYKVLLRALKIFGDESKADDYESWLSPVITVNALVPAGDPSTTPIEPGPDVGSFNSTPASLPLPSSNETLSAPPVIISNGTAAAAANSTSLP